MPGTWTLDLESGPAMIKALEYCPLGVHRPERGGKALDWLVCKS